MRTASVITEITQSEMHIQYGGRPRPGALLAHELEHNDALYCETSRDGVETMLVVTDEPSRQDRGVSVELSGNGEQRTLHGALIGSFDPDAGRTLFGQIVPGYDLVAKLLVEVDGVFEMRPHLLPPFVEQPKTEYPL